MLSKLNLTKKIYAFDTFEGMAQSSEIDKMLNNGPKAQYLMSQKLKDKNKINVHCYSLLNEVIANFKMNT
jgi:hypothetical protein